VTTQAAVRRMVERFDRGIEAVLRWDEETLWAISEHPWLKRLSRVFVLATYMGDGYLWGALSLGIILFGRSIDRSYLLVGLGISIVNITIFRLFKVLFSRPRPFLVPVSLRSRFVDVYSFPSGHTTISFGVAWVLGGFYQLAWVQVVAYLAAITIGVSRIFMKEHYPLDVICGAVLGSLIAAYLMPIFAGVLL